MARILLVDDSKSLLQLVNGWLVKAGHSVFPALDSSEARKLLKFSPDVIVCDNNMRTVNEGLEFGASLFLTSCPIPFVLHTSSSLLEVQNTLKRYKLHYVEKSEEPDALLQTIEEVLAQKSAAL